MCRFEGFVKLPLTQFDFCSIAWWEMACMGCYMFVMTALRFLVSDVYATAVFGVDTCLLSPEEVEVLLSCTLACAVGMCADGKDNGGLNSEPI